VLASPSWKRDLRLVPADTFGTAGQDQMEPVFPRIKQDQHTCSNAGIQHTIHQSVSDTRDRDHFQLGLKSGFGAEKGFLQ
jgi:hypothetical protein